MDRLSWYQPGESMEDILIQSGNVGIFDGDLKQSAFEQGTVSLTLQRVIWADASDPDCRLILHHSLVEKIEKHHKSMFGRGGKIVVTLRPVPAGHPQGPVAASGFSSLRFVFKNGGEDDRCSRQMWKRTSSSSSSAGSRTSHAHGTRAPGIAGIEKKLADQHNKTHETISQTIKFKSYLLSLGVSDPVTKASFGNGATYFEKLAEELTSVLLQPLKDCGGTMTLPEAYCRVNRARGVELISPEDLLNACQRLDQIQSPIRLYTFDSGVSVVQLRSANVEESTDEVYEFVKDSGSSDANKLAKAIGISVVLATERLLAAEAQGKLCRDDTIAGLVFFVNRLLDLEDGA
ncbi:Vacuolar protein sorting 36 containing protein [Aphelenchoides avenae]|nr:Vacuolar protein sorting 36 containing protein [Aphelenchus avenae]